MEACREGQDGVLHEDLFHPSLRVCVSEWGAIHFAGRNIFDILGLPLGLPHLTSPSLGSGSASVSMSLTLTLFSGLALSILTGTVFSKGTTSETGEGRLSVPRWRVWDRAKLA